MADSINPLQWRFSAPLRRVTAALIVAAGASLLAPMALLAQPPGGGGAPIDVAPVVRGDVYDEVMLTGSVVPRRFAQVSAEVGARVAEVLVDEGDIVAEGQVLVRLRAEPTELELREAQANAAQKRAVLEELRNGARAEDLAQARADVADAEAAVALAVADERRLETLLRSQTISQSEYDKVGAQRKRAEATLARMKAILERAENGARPEEIAAAEAELAAEEARVAQLQDQVERHVVKAPFDSVIGVKHTEKGQWVRQGDPMFSLAELDVVRIEVPLPEAYFRYVQQGTEAVVSFDALPGVSETLRVSARIPLANQAARTFPVRFEFENEGYRYAPGMMARVKFELRDDAGRQALLVPKDAIVMSPDRSEMVWSVRTTDQGTQVFAERIKTGKSFHDKVEVTESNLKEGDLVVTRGNETLFPGQKIDIRRGGDSATGEDKRAPAGGTGS
ncbi:MAG: hypothetical protein PWP23_329 [Candidatus Sumerlaeota bacterium]|nr:hypothetical protein [Candidatus Sumerlaeota bacterium]